MVITRLSPAIQGEIRPTKRVDLSFDLDSWNTFFKAAAVIAAGFTFAVGAGALWTETLLNRRQAEIMLGLRTDLAMAQSGLADAQGGLAAAQEGLAAQQARAAKLELDASAQKERAANAERELLQLQERLKPRTISAETYKRLVGALTSSRTKGIVEVSCINGDAEGCGFASRFFAALKEGGWPVDLMQSR